MIDRKSPSSAKLRLVPAREREQECGEKLHVAAIRDALAEIVAADARAKAREARVRGWPRLAAARHCRVSVVVDYAFIEKLAKVSEELSDGDDEPSIAELLDLALDHLSRSLPAADS
jgi:hypothetical protein